MNREYALAARALGYRDARIMFRHLLPNVLAPAFVFAMSDFVLDVLAGASLGFFGLGVQPPTPGVGRHDRGGPQLHPHGAMGRLLPRDWPSS